MLGKNVVYVIGRSLDRSGGIYHRPSHDQMTPWTKCGRELLNPMLMQREWAEHTKATPCPVCFGERNGEPRGD